MSPSASVATVVMPMRTGETELSQTFRLALPGGIFLGDDRAVSLFRSLRFPFHAR